MSKKSRKPEAPAAAARPVYSPRVRLGLALVFLLPAVPLFALISIAVESRPDFASFNASRFAEIRKILPPRGMAGYVSDLSGDRGSGALYIAQYSLVPVVLAPGTEHEPIVGNFDAADRVPEIMQKYGLHAVRDFGQGVMLLARDRK